MQTDSKLALPIFACDVEDLTSKHAPSANMFLKHFHLVASRFSAMPRPNGCKEND